MGALRTPHVGIIVLCVDVNVAIPANGKKTMAQLTTMRTMAKLESEVNVMFKVWK